MNGDEINNWLEDAWLLDMDLEFGSSAGLSRCCRFALNGALELGSYDDPELMKPYRALFFYCPECGSPIEQYKSRNEH